MPNLAPQLQLLADNQNALREARQLLCQLGSTMFGLFLPIDNDTPVGRAITGIRAQEERNQAAILAFLHDLPTVQKALPDPVLVVKESPRGKR